MKERDSFFRAVCSLAIPVALQSMLQSSFSIVDQIMIGQLGSVIVAGVQYVSSDKVARQIYDARLKTLNDRNSDMTIAREEGRQEGIEEGLAEGALQKAIETAKNLLLMQLSIEQIAQATGLSVYEIEQLK